MSTVTNKSLSLVDIPDYINTNDTELITKSVFSAASTKLFKIQTGVTAETALNLLNTTVTFGDGKSCGFEETVDSAVSQRTIVPGFIKVNAEYCDKDFLNTFANHKVAMAAGRETLPFEEYFVNDIIKNIGQELEKALWQGDLNSGSGNLAFFDGLYTIVHTDSTNQQAKGQDSIYDRVWKVYNAIEDENLDKTNIYMNKANYRALVKKLMEDNLYHYERNVDSTGDIMEMIFPGTDTKIIGVSGLTGVDAVIALIPNEVVYGCDLENDFETFKFWFSEDNDTFRLKVAFGCGVQVAFPSNTIINE